MQANVDLNLDLTETAFDQVIDRIFASRRITRADQERFMSVLLAKKLLTEAEQKQVSRIFDGLRSGLIKVVD
jgi:hypothetical protein